MQRLAHATHRTIDPTEFSPPLIDSAMEEAVVLADGTTLLALGMVDVFIAIQGYKETIHCIVINLSDDYDFILGDTWLYEHVSMIDYCHGHIRIVSRCRHRPISSRNGFGTDLEL